MSDFIVEYYTICVFFYHIINKYDAAFDCEMTKHMMRHPLLYLDNKQQQKTKNKQMNE